MGGIGENVVNRRTKLPLSR